MKILIGNYVSAVTTEDIAKKLFFWVKPKNNYDLINELPYPDYVYQLADFLAYGIKGDPNKNSQDQIVLTSEELPAFFQDIQEKHDANTTLFCQ